MVVTLNTLDGKVRVYETARGEGGGEHGPDKYITKCGMEWKTSPKSYESCDHIDCAIDIQRRSADSGPKGFLLFILGGVIMSFIIGSLLFFGISILVGFWVLISGFKAGDRFKELTEYNRQGTINGMRAFPADILSGLTNEKDCIGYGLALFDNCRYGDAIRAFNKALELNPDSAAAWYNKGNTLKSQNMHDDAIVAYDKVVELDPKFIDAWYNKGLALYDQHKYDRALVAYDRVLEIKPKLAKAWYNKGLALGNQGKYHEAILAYDKAIKIDSKYADAWYNKSLAQRSLGQAAEADATLDQAKRKLNCKGVDLSSSGKYFEAINAYDKAIEIDPEYLCAWINKGITLSKMGRYNEAIRALNQALEIKPESPRAWNYKGIALKKAGRKDDSKQALARARELGYRG